MQDINHAYKLNFQEGIFCVFLVNTMGGLRIRHFRKLCKAKGAHETIVARANLGRKYEYSVLINYSKPYNTIIQKIFENTYGICSFCVGGEYDDINNLLESYREAVAARRYANVSMRNIIYYDSTRNLEKRIREKEYSQILFALNRQDFKAAKCNLSALIERIAKDSTELALWQNLHFCSELFFSLMKFSIGSYATYNFKRDYENKISSASSYKDMESALMETIDEMERIFGYSDNGGELQKKDVLPVIIAKKYIEDNYTKPIMLDDIAAETGLNPSYFSHLFKKITGKSFLASVNEYRVEKAKELLIQTDDTISAIAQNTGFTESRYFAKVFKRFVGITPSEFRDTYR